MAPPKTRIRTLINKQSKQHHITKSNHIPKNKDNG